MRRLLSGWELLDPALARLMRINLAALASAIVGLSAAYALGFRHGSVRIDLAIMVLALVLMAATAPLSRLGPGAPIVGLTLSAAAFAVGGTWATPNLSPLTAILMLVPLLVAIPYLARRWIRVLMVVAVVGSAGIAALGEWRRAVEDDPGIGWVNALVIATSLPAVVLVVVFLVRDAYTRLQDQSDQLRESRLRIVQVADAARRSLERDLHDGVQQRLLAMSVTMERARRAMDQEQPDVARRLIAQLTTDNRKVLAEMRELARGIYPPLLTERGLVAAVHSASRRSVVPVTLHADDFRRPPADVETAAYFCILEGLTNAAKHSGCTRVVVELRGEPYVEFVVTDDGHGFDPDAVATSGLLGMEARVAAAGGVLTVETAPGAGTTLRGRFPVSGRDEG